MIDRYKKYEPLFGEWRISKLIGKGSFGEVYEIERENFGTIYKAALKAITIPVDESELNEIMSSGMSEAETKQYIRQSAKDIVNEFVLMSKLKGNTNIVSYEDHQVIEHEDQLGWDILMKMELLKPINEYIKENGFTKEDVVKLGIDLCTAIGLCEKYNIVHRDIKPENIFVSPNGDFKLGDFGIARSIERATMGLSKKGTYTYMAPEVYRGESYTEQVDLYSLGIVMYKFMNYNRIPFMPNYPSPVAYSDREQALMKRVNGEKLLPPCGVAEDKLVEIVLKACEYKPENRYQNALEMKEALEALIGKIEKQVVINPASKSISPSKEKAKVKKVERQELEEEIEKTLLLDREELTHSEPMSRKTGKKHKLWVAIAGGSLIAVAGGTILASVLLKPGENKPNDQPTYITETDVQIAATARMQALQEALVQKIKEVKADAVTKNENSARESKKDTEEKAKEQTQVNTQNMEPISTGQAVLKEIDAIANKPSQSQVPSEQKQAPTTSKQTQATQKQEPTTTKQTQTTQKQTPTTTKQTQTTQKQTPTTTKQTQTTQKQEPTTTKQTQTTQKQAQPAPTQTTHKETQPASKPTQKQETPKSGGQSEDKDEPPEIYINFD